MKISPLPFRISRSAPVTNVTWLLLVDLFEQNIIFETGLMCFAWPHVIKRIKTSKPAVYERQDEIISYIIFISSINSVS